MSQGSWDLWKHAQLHPWALKLSLLALWALWSLHHSLGTQHSFPWMVDPTTNVMFSAFFKNSLGLYLYPFSNMDYNLIFLSYLTPSEPQLWLYIIFQFLPVSSPFWLTSRPFNPTNQHFDAPLPPFPQLEQPLKLRISCPFTFSTLKLMNAV